ncbi:hypothetical protein MLIT_16900 [Mycolicibacterium litorale]|uniref:Uncharacterized protein n=1 Tax=Mycolicibacterium litorale TaxID=758802 RepID=A0AAD1IQW7_9MYCO|nr:hypothetical protein MLIT_16900 [Mycolicibacterium litorale]
MTAAVSATTGPSPGCSVCTWVSVTLNGPSTFTSGAVVSVDPVTATLPVAPGSVHSGVPALCGAAVGHVAGAATVSVFEDGSTSSAQDALVGDVLVAELSESLPQPARVMRSAAAQPARATG